MTIVHDDTQLMARASTGSQQAFSSLAEKHSPSLLHFCYSITQDAELAKDVLQAVLITWWQKAASWDAKKGALSTWLHRIARNKCIDILRKHENKLNCEFNEKEHGSNERSIEDSFITTETRLKIGNIVLNLPTNQRTAMLLTYYEDYANAEVAKQMNISVKAVESLLVRARKTLKTKLGGLEI